MADNVAITAGSGTSIATEEEGGAHYQVVKLVASGSGTTAALSKAEDTAHTTADHGFVALAVRRDSAAVGSDTDGDYSTLNVDASGALWATLRTAATAIGNVAHDSAIAEAPLRIGATAESSPKGVTLVTDGDVTNLYADLDGIQIIKTATAYGDLIAERVSNTDGASTAFSTFDNAAGTRNYITSVTVHNAHATTNGYVDIRDGTAGSIFWTFPLPATGGATHNFNPPLRQPTAATALAFDVSAAITTVYLSVNGFKSKA